LLISGLLWKAEFLWEKNNYNAKYHGVGELEIPLDALYKIHLGIHRGLCKGAHKRAAGVRISISREMNSRSGCWAGGRFLRKSG